MDNIRHLYVIGNGFDIYHGVHSEYSRFEAWLVANDKTLYERLSECYNVNDDGEDNLWSDFERNLGYPNIKGFKAIHYESFRLPVGPNYNVSIFQEHSSGNAFGRLKDDLAVAFKKWVKTLDISVCKKHPFLKDGEDVFYLTFNYTDTLEQVYNIPSERILHIHGQASKDDKLIFGSGRSMGTILWDEYGDEFPDTEDEENLVRAVGSFTKNTQHQINENHKFFSCHKNLNSITVIGYSFSPIDGIYLDKLLNFNPQGLQWRISWHTKIDKVRITSFCEQHDIQNAVLFKL